MSLMQLKVCDDFFCIFQKIYQLSILMNKNDLAAFILRLLTCV